MIGVTQDARERAGPAPLLESLSMLAHRRAGTRMPLLISFDPWWTAARMASKKTTKKQSKSAFVRAQPATASTADIIAAGKKAGLNISTSLVYMVRGAGKKRGRKEMRMAARRSTARTAPAVARPIKSSTKAEDLLRAVAAEVGLGRAIELLEAERARVHAVLRG